MSTVDKKYTEFVPNPKIPFRRLGPSGLRVPVFSLGGWLTIGGTVKGDPVKEIMQTAFENGINMIDVAEGYAAGESEREVGRVMKELNWRRTDLIISTKIFFGTRTGPNDRGLSRKHVIEGLKESLERLQLDYVDIVFAHRPDPSVPMEEVVRAFNYVIEKGQAFYWGTSEWSAEQIEEAFHVAAKLHLIAPIAEQCEHNAFHRQRPEGEYASIYAKYGYGTTVFSGLAGGLLTGKYNDGIPAGSRFATEPDFKSFGERLHKNEEGLAKIAKVKALTELAKKELDCGVAQISLAWIAHQKQTSTVILGASSKEQLLETLKVVDVLPKYNDQIHEKVNALLDNGPKFPYSWGR